MEERAKRFAKYYDQCRLPKWLTGLGMGFLVLGLLGAIIIAVFHDRYFSIFGVWDFALTHIWFMVFLALVFTGNAKSGRKNPNQATKRYKTTNLMRQRHGMAPAQLKLKKLNDNP